MVNVVLSPLLSQITEERHRRRYGAMFAASSACKWVAGRGLNSFTSQLNMSASYGIWGARRGCVAGVKGGLGGV